MHKIRKVKLSQLYPLWNAVNIENAFLFQISLSNWTPVPNMPISEDEFDYSRSQESQSIMSKAELRKTHKPIMEKRRRARINHCLNEIKTLILEAMNKDVRKCIP